MSSRQPVYQFESHGTHSADRSRRVTANLTTTVVKPQTEAQVRELTDLEPEAYYDIDFDLIT
jgi:hypothetical protein